ncbi:MAG TPA: cytochrome b [Luteimonas sp.]|nr:cytochrome b [Luteimonas sp.]
MTLKNVERWGAVSQTFHWLIVLLILTIATVGLIMVDLPKTPKYFWVYTLHKSLGLTVLTLAVLRLGWRLYAGAPPPVAGTPRWQERIASITHWLLYGLIFAMPLSGWLYDSSSGLRPFRWFGLVEVPKLSPPNESVRSLSHDAHETLFWVLAFLVVAHAGAALYHHLIQNDATLTRMLPRRRSKPEPPPQELNDVG